MSTLLTPIHRRPKIDHSRLLTFYEAAVLYPVSEYRLKWWAKNGTLARYYLFGLRQPTYIRENELIQFLIGMKSSDPTKKDSYPLVEVLAKYEGLERDFAFVYCPWCANGHLFTYQDGIVTPPCDPRQYIIFGADNFIQRREKLLYESQVYLHNEVWQPVQEMGHSGVRSLPPPPNPYAKPGVTARNYETWQIQPSLSNRITGKIRRSVARRRYSESERRDRPNDFPYRGISEGADEGRVSGALENPTQGLPVLKERN